MAGRATFTTVPSTTIMSWAAHTRYRASHFRFIGLRFRRASGSGSITRSSVMLRSLLPNDLDPPGGYRASARHSPQPLGGGSSSRVGSPPFLAGTAQGPEKLEEASGVPL